MTGQQLKKAGLDRVESNNLDWLDRMRGLAESECALNGSVTIDTLRRWADTLDDQPDHPNAWGAVFRGSDWKCIGRVKSTYRSNHAREIKVWTLA